MGIDTYFYTIFGVKTEWDDALYEDYDPVYDDKDTPWVLIDGMSGKYFIFGIPLFQSGNFRCGFDDGDFYKEINLDNLEQLEAKYREDFSKKFPSHTHVLGTEPFKLISLIHFS